MVSTRSKYVALGLTLLGAGGVAWAGQVGSDAQGNAILIVAPEVDTANGASPYFAAGSGQAKRFSRQDLELTWSRRGLKAQATLRDQLSDSSTPERRGILNQLYYDSEADKGLGWTVGKKVMSWGVGQAFRPLDVVQREDLRRVNASALKGMPLLALNVFGATDAWTLAWVRPGAGRGNTDFQDESLALHGYRLTSSGDDLHMVMRISRRHGLEAGLGATHVLGEFWSFNSSILLEQRHQILLNALTAGEAALASTDPMIESARHGGVKAQVGAQWTGTSGLSIIAEAWFDGDAWRLSDWRQLNALTARQRALTGLVPEAILDGNLAWSSEAYQAPDLLQQNLLLRVSWDNGDGFKPYTEILEMPEDGGFALTLGASLETNRQRISFGLRKLGGPAGSVAARAPVSSMAWIEWRWAIY